MAMLALLTTVLLSLQVHALWPIPRELTTGSTALRLAPYFNINVDVKNAPSDLLQAVSQTKSYLQNDKLEALVVGRGASSASEISAAKQISALTISLTPGATVKSISEEAVAEITSRSDEYKLTVPDDGSAATLTANSTLGLYRGLTTFSQLWYYLNGEVYSLETPVQITDYPAYVRLKTV